MSPARGLRNLERVCRSAAWCDAMSLDHQVKQDQPAGTVGTSIAAKCSKLGGAVTPNGVVNSAANNTEPERRTALSTFDSTSMLEC